MILFEPLISWIWTWLFAVVILVILGLQFFWIQKSNLTTLRKAIKLILNALLSIVLIGFVFQPVWKSTKPEQAVLVYSATTEKSKVNVLRDSLDLKKSFPITNYKGDGNPIYLLGSDFSQEELLKLRNKKVHWVRESEPGSISFLEWKGILNEGEKQVIRGKMDSSDSLRISLTQQGELLEETELAPYLGAFSFEFPASIQGRNELDLTVNDSLYGRINFFATEATPIRYSLKFAFPDPEIRFLSQYLINSGERVSEEIDVSKVATITSGRPDSDSLQFLIVDPAQLKKKSIQEAIAGGASVLVMNLNDVGKDVSSINNAFESNFKVKRNTAEESRIIEPELESAPFAFEEVIAQKLFFENGFAVQQVGNAKVGVSLLGKTFPIKLAGDSMRYQAIWKKILGEMLPQQNGGIELTQPVFAGLRAEIHINKEGIDKDFISIESDSVYLQQSLVNPYSWSGSFISLDSGWVSIADSLEIYSYSGNEWPSLKAWKLRADFLKIISLRDHTSVAYTSEQKLSYWWWYGIFLLILTMLWIEPKILY